MTWLRNLKLFILSSLLLGAGNIDTTVSDAPWSLTVLPSSLRLDPVSNQIIEQDFVVKSDFSTQQGILDTNWIYDGEKVTLHAARGEYISFQIVLTNHSEFTLENIQLEVSRFRNQESSIAIQPELFLEWSVEVREPSTGYPQASLGTGWYPDALIPFRYLQLDSSKVRRWTAPLRLPDFNNRIQQQQSLIVWVDQYVPFGRNDALPGNYEATIRVTIGDRVQEIPVTLRVWDFALPNRNLLGGSLQHEGFVSRMSEEDALEIYQLMKRHRISVMDPTYKPGLNLESDGTISLDWTRFDHELTKYFNGEAFTSAYGYDYGPGYGAPIENFVLPFDVYGKHHTTGWPDTGPPDTERNPEQVAIYVETIRQVRDHLQSMLEPEKTDLTVYLNGLDESYFPEAWSRMVFYGDLFKKHYPESHFRIDGAYSEEAMEYVSQSIDYWGSHTINYNIDKVRTYQNMGIKDWLYGPLLYESEVNGWVGSCTFIDLPLVNDRALSWSCWKYGVHSWLSWGIGAGWKRAWYDPESWKDVYKSGPGSDREFPYKKINGSGLLVYSGGIVPNVGGPCPSIRLKSLRDGVQEYEYLRLLSELTGNRDKANAIVNQLVNEPFGDLAIGVLDVWEYDPEKWDSARLEMGGMIEVLARKQ